MEKITKVKDINITKLNNAEYRTFMARYGNLLAGGGGDSESPDEISFDPNDPLGIPQELRTAFATDFALLTDAVNQSSASEETAQMSALDKERDDLLIFITSTITQMTKSPLAAQRTAAEKLYLADLNINKSGDVLYGSGARDWHTVGVCSGPYGCAQSDLSESGSA